MRRMAVGACDAIMGVRRGSPVSVWFALSGFVALQADFGSLGGLEVFEVQDEPWLLAARRQVPAGRTMAVLAFLLAMNVVLECRNVGLVTRHAQLVVVNEFCISNFRIGDLEYWISRFLKSSYICIGPERNPFRSYHVWRTSRARRSAATQTCPG